MEGWDFANGFGVMYLISQIFALTATTLDLIAVQRRKKVQLLNFNTVSATFSALHYLFLGAWSGLLVKILGATRDGVAAYEASKKKTSKILPIIFVAFYIVAGIVSYKSPVSLLPTIASSIYTIVIYTADVSKVRKAAVVCTLFWLIYNICAFSIVAILSDTIFITDGLVAIYRYRKKTKKRRTVRKVSKKKKR